MIKHDKKSNEIYRNRYAYIFYISNFTLINNHIFNAFKRLKQQKKHEEVIYLENKISLELHHCFAEKIKYKIFNENIC